jgi:hypothetical protein
VISGLLVVFRSRKWPEFFAIGLMDAAVGEDDSLLEQEQRRIAPLLNTYLTYKVLNSIKSGKSNSSFNSNDPVVIINPFQSIECREADSGEL